MSSATPAALLILCFVFFCLQDGDDNDTKTAMAMYAKDGEYVEFPGPCDCNGQVRNTAHPLHTHTRITNPIPPPPTKPYQQYTNLRPASILTATEYKYVVWVWVVLTIGDNLLPWS